MTAFRFHNVARIISRLPVDTRYSFFCTEEAGDAILNIYTYQDDEYRHAIAAVGLMLSPHETGTNYVTYKIDDLFISIIQE